MTDGEATVISEHVGSSPFTIVVTTSCTLIGVMVVIVLAVVLRWLRARRAVNRLPPSPDLQSSNPAIMVPPYSAAPSELDRLALIAFADDVFPPPMALLPTYEEAVRCGGGAAYAPHVVPDVSRRNPAGFIRSSRNEYRPLDNGHQCVRDGALIGDQRRNSVVTTASNSLSAGVSAGFGSFDTINVAGASDATSTSVTVNTYDSMMASNPSIAPSQRAARGSLGSSSTQASLVGDGQL